jgi:hypothetical protein
MLCAWMLALGGASVAHANTFYWYGESPDCWQTGTPSAPNKACDYPGGSSTGNAITGDLNVPQSGDYCNVYFVTASCANQDAVWPMSFDSTSEPCPAQKGARPCGVQHYASLNTQEDFPWSSGSFSEPALVVSTELAIKINKTNSTWAYLCPVLQAPSPHNAYLEYCFDEWQGAKSQVNLPEPPFAAQGYGLDVGCAGVTVGGTASAVDTLVSPFALNQPTPYGTTLSGSVNTGTGEGTAVVPFTAEITLANLQNAINRDNEATNPSHPETPGPGYGCARGLSSNLSGYRLVGVEDGTEGYPSTSVNATTQNLRAWTAYTTGRPGTPFAFREPNTGNEDIFYRGSDNALWQVAWTPSGGWKSPYRIGGVLTSDPMGFIEPNETMDVYYRGTNNAIWVYYREPSGHWSTFEVDHEAPLSAGKTFGYMFPDGTKAVFYCSMSHVISLLYYNGIWNNPGMAVGEAAPCEGDPVAYLQPSGMQNVFYRTTGGDVGQVWWNSAGWHSSPISVGGSMVGTPTAYLEPNGMQNVFFRTTSNSMGQVWWNSEGWHNSPLGGEVFGNPDAFMTPNGFQHVYYVNHFGTIGEWWWESSSGWHNHELGEGAASDPNGFALPNGEVAVFFFENGTYKLDQWRYDSSGSWTITTVEPRPQPAVTSVSPNQGSSGGGTSVTIGGTNFMEVSAVKFGTAAASSFRVASSTSITAVAPAGSGTVDVTVTAAGGTSVANTGDQFAYQTSVTPVYSSAFGSSGSGNGQFKHPADITLDSKANLWVLDRENDRVQQFSEKGEFKKSFGSAGASNGQLSTPDGLAVDAKANVWVVDSGNFRVQEFNEKANSSERSARKAPGTGSSPPLPKA